MNQRKIREAQKCPIATESDSRSIKSKFYFQVVGDLFDLFDPFYLLVGKTYFFLLRNKLSDIKTMGISV